MLKLICTVLYAEAARKYMPNAKNWSDEQVDKAVSNLSPLARVGVLEDISRVLAFLVS
jgi:hypothetical protein